MTRDDTPAGAAGPHGRPDPDSAPPLDPDDADAPSLAAARAAWRSLREPLAPGPDLDARIRGAARRASAGPRPTGGSALPGGAAPARVPASALRRVRRYAGWGLALAATLVVGIVLVLPPAPLSDLPLEAPPKAGPASSREAGAVVGDPAAIAALPPDVPPVIAVPPPGGTPETASMPPDRGPGSRPATTAYGTADARVDGTAEARVDAWRLAPATSAVPVADPPTAGAQVAPPSPPAAVLAAPPAKARADVEATSSSSPPSASVARAAQATSAVVSSPVDAAPPSLGDAAAITQELAELRALLRARDPALPARLRAFVARHPAHPLARTDPALAALLAREPGSP